MKKKSPSSVSKPWLTLNTILRTANEETCHALLKAELKGRRRTQFLRRIHSRLNKVRADRERLELLKQ